MDFQNHLGILATPAVARSTDHLAGWECMVIIIIIMSVIVAPKWMPMECTALCVRERLAKHPDITLSMTWSPVLSLLQVCLSLKSLWVCSDQTASGRMASHLSPGQAVKRYVGTSQWHIHWLTHTSMQPPESQARRQSLPLRARKRSMLILMAVTHLNRSPLRHWAHLTRQIASSCVISVARYLRTQGKSEKRAFCSKDAQCSCNVLMPYCSTTVYLLMTAPIDFSYLFSYFFQ